MIEMEIVQNRELLQSVGRVTSATCADLTTLQRQSCGLSEENHAGAGILSFTTDASFSAQVDKRSAPQLLALVALKSLKIYFSNLHFYYLFIFQFLKAISHRCVALFAYRQLYKRTQKI